MLSGKRVESTIELQNKGAYYYEEDFFYPDPSSCDVLYKS